MKIARNKLISILLIVMLVFSSTMPAFADTAEEASKEEQKQEEQLEAKKEAEEKAKKEAEKKAAEEKARKEAEEKARKEAEAKKAAEEQAKKEAEEKARKEAEAKKAAEEQAKKEAEEKAAAEADGLEGADDSSDTGSSSDDQDQAAPTEEPEAENGAEEVLIDESEPEDDAAEEKKSSLKLQTGLTDGTYKPDSFEFSGGTGKARVTCDKVIIKDGKATAEFTASSENMTHFYMGTVSSDAEDTSLYDPATGKRGKDVYKITDKKAYVEVVLNEKKPFAGRTTAMTEPHWVQYEYKLTLSDDAKKTSDDTTIPDQGDDQGEDSGSTGLSNGTYKPEAFNFSGGTGKAKVTCEKVIVKNGKATAEFTASSENMTHFYMGTVASDAEDKSLYDPATDKCGDGVYKLSSKKAYVPVTLNEQKPFAGRTTAMSEPHWVQYQYKITLTEKAEKISDDTTIPGEQGDDPDPSDPSGDDPDPSGGDEPSDTKTLKDGTYKVNATTDRKMFYLYPKEKNPATVILVKKNGKMTATITLTGDGYDYVYMGTPAQAKKAGKKKWIKYKKVNGYYTFEIPVSKLDKKLPITPHSSKYESDGDPKTDPWRPDKWILFYSSGAKKVKDGAAIPTKKKKNDEGNATSGSQTKFKNDNKADKQSKYKDDSGKSTSAVNNSTSLKDGVYTPDRFNWSGGSGRLRYIRCNKITVKGGKAFATIEFGSSKYDSLKANGRIYSRSGGGNSKFTIPVKLNANNTIIGRTTAMSQPHWVKYRIFIYKKGAASGKNGASDSAEGDDGHVTSTKKLSSKAPDLMGLEFKEEVKVEHAEYFKIYKYEQGVILIEVDQGSNTALYKEDKKEEDKDADSNKSGGETSGEGDDAASSDLGHVEYDEDGNIIAQSQNEIVDGLYQNNVVNYIVVPEKVEIPAGLDKDGIILQQPIDKTFLASPKAAEALEQLGLLDKVKTVGFDAEKDGSEALKKELDAESMTLAGTVEKPDYAELVKTKANMGIFPSAVLPEKLKKDASEEEKAESDEKTKNIGILRKRFSALGVPMLIDRSDDEKTNYGSAEWIKVYGAVFGKEEEAGKIFDDFVAKNKKENNEK